MRTFQNRTDGQVQVRGNGWTELKKGLLEPLPYMIILQFKWPEPDWTGGPGIYLNWTVSQMLNNPCAAGASNLYLRRLVPSHSTRRNLHCLIVTFSILSRLCASALSRRLSSYLLRMPCAQCSLHIVERVSLNSNRLLYVPAIEVFIPKYQTPGSAGDSGAFSYTRHGSLVIADPVLIVAF